MDRRVGYRFHPTEVELIDYFLKNKMLGHESKVRTIAEVDVCKFEPWDLPQHCATDSNNRSWYFFSRPIYKYSNSKRANRKTNAGYWKVTGKERDVKNRTNKVIGTKRTLVFHEGRCPKGVKTNWVIHEYHPNSTSSNEKDFVVCRLKKKNGGKTDSLIRNEGETSSNHHMTSGIDRCIVDSSSPEVNLDLLAKSSSPTGDDGFASTGNLQDQIEQSPENSPCINDFSRCTSGLVSQDGTSMLPSQVDTSEQEDDLTELVNSFLVDEDEFIGEGNEDAHLHDSRPLKSSSVDADKTGTDIDTEMVYGRYKQGGGSWNLFDGHSSSKQYKLMKFQTCRKETGGYSHDELLVLDICSPASTTKDPYYEIYCLQLPSEVSSADRRTSKTLLQKELLLEETELWSTVSGSAVS